MNRKNQWQSKVISFMRGRYGIYDKLNKHMIILAFVFLLIGMFKFKAFFQIAALLLIAISYFRMFSKKIYVRSNENTRYVGMFNKVKAPFTTARMRFQTRKEFKYFNCPSCKQSVRVPINKGKVRITCPSCQTKFEKKT